MGELEVDRAMQQAIELHRAGQLAQAERIYRQVLEVEPNDSDALHLLGVIALAAGRLDEAEALLGRAVDADNQVPEFHLDLARCLLGAHKFEPAAQALARASEATIASAQPDFAVDAARQLVSLAPADAKSHFVLGNAQRAAGSIDDARVAYQRALELDPTHVAAMLHLASVCWMSGRLDDGIEACRRAIAQDRELAIAHHTLGAALEKAGRFSEAADAYRHALRLDPSQENWKFDLAVVNNESPAAPPRDFVARLFDEYAPRFEEHLVHRLHYQVPERLLELVAPHVLNRKLDILDLGCGTGRCAKLFAPHARSIHGIDVSPKMVDIARSTGLYTIVQIADAAEALRDAPSTFDLILAADVFIYIGDLSTIFPLVANALGPGALFAFSIESQPEPGFALRPTRRYTHSLSYILSLANRSRLKYIQSQDCTLRHEGPNPVPGQLLLLQKPHTLEPHPKPG